ncbi:phytanoyl-CoA dioxygenase family protein [Kitasatospora sp. NPDC058965]|uniref:phytanoyl-CoA dioxygenase family protein n=1 Tax=Kitasatospora sp. NPDC058965 TaxID=3346682 RepID=UPI0036BCF727
MTDSRSNRYAQDGYLLLDALDPAEVAGLLAEADRFRHLAAPMTHSSGDFNLEARGGGYHGQDGGAGSYPGVLRKVSNAVRHSDLVAEVSRKPAATALVTELLGGREHRLVHSIVWYKAPKVGSPKPPHQDAPYLTGPADDYVTLWIALDPCTVENGCLEVIPGSNRAGAVGHLGGEARVTDTHWQTEQARPVPMDPGQALAFHPHLLHASGPNHSDRPRRALTLRYQALTSEQAPHVG